MIDYINPDDDPSRKWQARALEVIMVRNNTR
jgi:hypothetical protein